MKIGLFLVLFSNESFESALDRVQELGLDTVEIGTGNYPGNAHCRPELLLKNADARKRLLDAVKSRNLEISALSCHGNMLHPNTKIADAHQKTFMNTILLAEKLGVSTIINFSGTPGGGPKDKTPNWVTCPWPNDFSDTLKWQWDKKIIPYWKKMSGIMKSHDTKVAIEMHPGFAVYNTESMLRLRNECGKNIGCNLDPSHLFWQGMDPMTVIRELKESIFHCHAKDTKIYEPNSLKNGVLDTKPYTKEINRSWIFRTVGYGHGKEFWSDFVSTLRMVGYNGTLSIEHEDSLMSGSEGLNKAITLLKEVVISEDSGKAWWT